MQIYYNITSPQRRTDVSFQHLRWCSLPLNFGFIKALDETSPVISPNKTTIVLTGGEPIIRKDVTEIGTELYRRGLTWGVVSNGLGRNRPMIERT